MPTERTPLRTSGDHVPPYVFMYSQHRSYKNRIKRFQCCMCAGLLAVFITALVVTVSYSVNHANDSNSTVPENSSSLQTLLALTWPLKDVPYTPWDDGEPTTQDITSAVETGHKGLLLRESYEEVLPNMQKDSPSFRHQLTTKTMPQARILSKTGYVIDLASRELRKNKKTKVGRGPQVPPKLLPDDVCKESVTRECPPARYRSADGTCNNLEHPSSWGVGLRPFRRILPPDYADGVSLPRRGKDGGALPSARQVSLSIHRPVYRDDPEFTVMLAVWGQFIDHDMTATALSQGKGGNAITCCFTYLLSGLKQHPECYTVNLAPEDPYYEDYNVTCMEFVRSAPSPVCHFGPREQMNQASSFLDGSSVYGTTDEVINKLRLFEGGLLKMLVTSSGRELLPVSTDLGDGCNRVEEFNNGRYCFLSGDPRSNENIHLTSMHLLFARQHNLVSRKLADVNPHWDDERLFQESRKIVSSQLQHITYSEFLPVVLGPVSSVVAQSTHYFEGYNADVDPSIANSFAASAFRFGHSLLPGLIKLIGNDTSSEEYVELHKMLFNPFDLYENEYLEKVVMGASNTNMQRVDTFINKELTAHLFERRPSVGRPKGPCGLDLVSLNVQRGRDHGLPGYPAWRRHCGLSVPRTFDDLTSEVDLDTLHKMKAMYKSVDDIDMYTGALAELPVEGGIIGPTLTCLLTDQFLRLKIGDRFWYETSEQPQAFTQGQLNELRKTTLAKIMCDTSGIGHSQPLVMKAVGDGNQRGSCEDIPAMDLSYWKEEVESTNSYISLHTAASDVKSMPGGGESPTWTPDTITLGGRVTSGKITIGDKTLWNGELPLAVSLPFFDAVASSGDDQDTRPTAPSSYVHNIAWEGSVRVTGGGGSLHASFSLPRFDPQRPQPVVAWYNGQIDLDFAVLSNTANEEAIVFEDTFASEVHFNFVKPYEAVANATVLKANETVLPSTDPTVTDTFRVAPFTLTGFLNSADFVWDGNFTVMLPTSRPEKPLLQMAYTPPYYVKRVRVGARVESGTVNAQGMSVWNGQVPMAIPVQPFDSVARTDARPDQWPAVFGHGILWTGSLVADSSNNAKLSGTFSMPRYVHGNGLVNFTIRWYNGDFNLGLKLLWNSTGDDQIDIGGRFTTPVFFAQRDQYNTLKNQTMEDSWNDLNTEYSSTPKELSPGQKQGMKAPIILLGTYSNNRTHFLWSGDITLVVPVVINVLSSSLQRLKMAAPKQSSRLAMRLLGGQVNVDGWNVWSGILPVAISVDWFDSVFPTGDTTPRVPPNVLGHGILWNGTLEPVDSSSARLHGTFSLPRHYPDTGTSNSSIRWINGNFDLHIQLNATFSLNGSYSTSVIFAERKEFENLRPTAKKLSPSLKELGVSPTDLPLVLASDSFGNYISVPLILLGAYSLDHSQFLWSGNFILGATKTKEEFPLLSSTDISSTVQIAARAVAGNIASQGSPAWEGFTPVSFPVAPLVAVSSSEEDLVREPLYEHGVLWSGSLFLDGDSNTGLLSGTFSLPAARENDSDSVNWYNGEFSLKLSILWMSVDINSTNFSGRYSSPVYFQSRKQYEYLRSSKPPEVSLNLLPSNVSSESPSGVSPGPLILTGTFSQDRSRFLWSGDLTLKLPPIPHLLVQNSEPETANIKGFVVGGSVTSAGTTVWVGNRIPISLPLEGLLSKGGVSVSWKGAVATDTPGVLKLWGSYSILSGTDSTGNTLGYTGDFAFQVAVFGELKHLTIDSEFLSPVHLYSSPEYESLKTQPPQVLSLSGVSLDSNKRPPDSSLTPMYLPVTLLGTYSTDKSLFIWSGNITLTIPVPSTGTFSN